MKKGIFLVTSDDLMEEVGDAKNEPEQHYSGRKARPHELQTAAEIAVFLEDDLQVDVRRLYIQVREGILYVQGSVETEQQLQDIKEMLPNRPNVQEVDLNIYVQRSLDD